MTKHRPGKVVKCADGAIGRTYNDEMPHDGKLCVHILALDAKKLKDGPYIKTPERRLCDPATLKVIGFAD
jgi:hypothetical protein